MRRFFAAHVLCALRKAFPGKQYEAVPQKIYEA